MIDLTILKIRWEEEIGYTLFEEEGDVEHFYRENHDIIEPVSGLWTTTPVTLSAVKNPTIAMMNANITMAVPDSRLIEVRNRLNEKAEELNGTAFQTEDGYTISYNCQTCSIGDKQIIGAGAGEYFPVYQTISYVIIEGGVSAYDVKLKIDNLDVPVLTLVETKVNTTQTVPDATGIGRALSQQELIGFDFTCPFTDTQIGDLFHWACSEKTGNEIHYAEYICNGEIHPHLVIFGNCTENVQPPANVGFNISIVDGEPLIGDFGPSEYRAPTTVDGFNVKPSKHVDFGVMEAEQVGVSSEISAFGVVLAVWPQYDGKEAVTIFWGDGTKNHYPHGTLNSNNYHYYQDGQKLHQIVVHMGE